MLDRIPKPDVAARSPRSVPARYPPGNLWPPVMRAYEVAAFLSFETTGQLYKAIERHEAPPPTATRLRNGKREPLWALEACRKFVADQHGITSDDAASKGENIGDLI